MAWETRQRGSRYYTRSHRIRGRVTREYFGAGEQGEQAAWQDRLRRDAQAEEKMRACQQRERSAQAEKVLAVYCQQVETRLREALAAAGYHQHDRGEWRRRRGIVRRG